MAATADFICVHKIKWSGAAFAVPLRFKLLIALYLEKKRSAWSAPRNRRGGITSGSSPKSAGGTETG